MKSLVSCSTGLGNFILKLPMLRYLEKKGELFIFYRSEPWIAPITNYLGLKANLITSTDTQKLPDKFEYIFLPFDSTPREFIEFINRYKTANVIQHIPPRKGKHYLMERLLHPFRKWVDVPVARHETQLNLDLLRKAFPAESFEDTSTAFSLKPNASRTNTIIIQPGAANGTMGAKIWPPKHFSDLIRMLRKDFPDFKIKLVGDMGDAESLKNFINEWEALEIESLIGRTNLESLIKELSTAKLVICHDSGIMHLSNSLSTPLIALYGPTDELRTGPLASTSHIILGKHKTRAAMRGFKITERELSRLYPNNECLKDITPDDVMNKVKEIAGNNEL